MRCVFKCSHSTQGGRTRIVLSNETTFRLLLKPNSERHRDALCRIPLACREILEPYALSLCLEIGVRIEIVPVAR